MPSSPPASQNELLAAVLHPIVSFAVLGSIIIRMFYCSGILNNTLTLTFTTYHVDGLSIPAFQLGQVLLAIQEGKTRKEETELGVVAIVA